MAKFSGEIGFSVEQETKPGVWKTVIVPRHYYGDVTRNLSRNQNNSDLNGDVTLSNQISIVADPFANENFQSIKYVQFMGAKWRVSDAEVKYPRIILNMGGIYNG